MDLAHVLWIGGPDGGATSAVARALARRFDLQLYVIDDHAATHAPRMPRSELRPTSRGRLDSFLNIARHRFRLVLEDLRGLPDSPPAVVAGPQLLPTSVAAVLRSAEQSLFLVPEPDPQREQDLLVAQRYFYEARDLRLKVLRIDAPLGVMIERAAEHFAQVAASLSAATDRSP